MSFGGLYTSISGLQASRKSLDTVSHNISNANNRNYVRQSAIHANNPYTKLDGKFEVGTGVSVIQIRQIRDEFLDLKLRREMGSFGYHYAKSQILGDVEEVFNEITNKSLEKIGLQEVMSDFWDNWNELFKESDSLTVRGLVHESSVAFADTVNHISNQLDSIRQDLNTEILNKVEETNSILNRIGQLNKSIKLAEGENSKMMANDFRDERNALLDRLSELLPITSYENTYGETVVHLHGKDLVNSSFISTIDIKADPKTGFGNIYFQYSNEIIDLKGSGELGGYIDARDQSMTQYMDRLNTLVSQMAKAVNEVHRSGTDLLGNEGEDFFLGTIVDGEMVITASNIRINPELANLNKIAASKTGDIGDGDIAKEIYEIRKMTLFNSYGSSGEKDMNTDEYYRDLLLTLGMERQESRDIALNQGFLIQSIDDKRKSISGVSLDEEMVDMIKFQHSYVANSRVINAIDEMIENVVNRVGLVGR